MKILVATDAWLPQINGVVATYMRLASEVPALGASLAFLTPDDFRTVAMPMYPEIGLDEKRPATSVAGHLSKPKPQSTAGQAKSSIKRSTGRRWR